MVIITRKAACGVTNDYLVLAVSLAAGYFRWKSYQLSLVFLGLHAMRRLNSRYRRIDRPTDVLSFSYESARGLIDGEIIICSPVAKAQAKKFQHSFKDEVLQLLVHGLAHLAGYDHHDRVAAAIMGACEKNIWEKLILHKK